MNAVSARILPILVAALVASPLPASSENTIASRMGPAPDPSSATSAGTHIHAEHRRKDVTQNLAGAASAAANQGAGWYSGTPEDARLYQGARYVAASSALVRAKAEPSARIVFDIPRGVLLYAKPSASPGWLQVTGSGSRRYPFLKSPYERPWRPGDQTITPKSPIGLVGQKLDLRKAIDGDSYFPLAGFVRASDVIPADPPAVPAVAAIQDTVVPKQIWASLGVEDQRRFVLRLDKHPFDAVVLVQVELQEKGLEGKLAACTGFFVEDTRTVITAAHCMQPLGRAYQTLRISIPRDSGLVEVLDGDVIYHSAQGIAWGGDLTDGDVAILRLRAAPKTPVIPLRFAPPEVFASAARIPAYLIGFPADLTREANERWGWQPPSYAKCEVLLGDSRKLRIASGTMVPMRDCISWNGNSGGPLLVWNPRDQRFDVAGVLRGSKNKQPVRLMLDEAALRRIDSVAASIGFDAKALDDEDQHFGGKSALLTAIRRTADPHQTFSDSAFDDEFFAVLSRTTARSIRPFYERLEFADGVPRNYENRTRAQNLVDALRRVSASQKDFAFLDPRFQIDATLFGKLDVEDLRRHGVPFRTSAISKMNEKVRKAAISENDVVVAVGGDLFIIDSKTQKILDVVRRFMNFAEDGDEFVGTFRYAEHADCSDAQSLNYYAREAGPPWPSLTEVAPDLTPVSIAGVQTVSTKAAQCLTRRFDSRLVILAVQGEAFGLPGAYRLPWGGLAGHAEDAIQKSLVAAVEKLTGGNRDHPILVYCHFETCRLSPMAALRLREAGYRQIYWMRDGIDGWIASGLPLGIVKDVSVAAPQVDPHASRALPSGWIHWTNAELGLSALIPAARTESYKGGPGDLWSKKLQIVSHIVGGQTESSAGTRVFLVSTTTDLRGFTTGAPLTCKGWSPPEGTTLSCLDMPGGGIDGVYRDKEGRGRRVWRRELPDRKIEMTAVVPAGETTALRTDPEVVRFIASLQIKPMTRTPSGFLAAVEGLPPPPAAIGAGSEGVVRKLVSAPPTSTQASPTTINRAHTPSSLSGRMTSLPQQQKGAHEPEASPTTSYDRRAPLAHLGA